jgi:hypothetical protein
MAALLPPSRGFTRLPTELLLLIIDFIPVDHILPLRTVCRSVKKHIDTSVLHSYLCRTTIAADFVPVSHNTFGPLSQEVGLSLMKFTYSHIENKSSSRTQPASETSRAVFRVLPQWLDAYNRVRASSVLTEEDTGDYLYVNEEEYRPEADECPVWFVQLDHIALDLDTGTTTRDDPDGHYYTWNPGYFRFETAALTVTIDWKLMLRNFLVMAAEIQRRKIHATGIVPDLAEEHANVTEHVPPVPVYTYGSEEDFIRDSRRDYFWRLLDTMQPKDYNVDQGLIRLPRLFGQENWAEWGDPSGTAQLIQSYEDHALRNIMALRGGK